MARWHHGTSLPTVRGSGGGGSSITDFQRGLIRTIVKAGENETIPADSQYILMGTLTVDGSLTINGTLIEL